ncbi:helix-turn-helix domain-containing protein [Pseudomonas chengduensis]|nr:helix-turn-helix transcriptional regulator [Pseudomonas chengduensis]MDH1866880.1 helix-turn-helix domain-containing protein [Pseudomonas chengduensis]
MTEADQNNLAGLVGQAIAKQRIRKGLTQEQVAERLRIGNEAVSRIERGIVIPNIARLLEFAAIFECGAAELLTEVSPRSDDQARRLHDLISPLSPDDRQLVMDVVERLVEHLGSH